MNFKDYAQDFLKTIQEVFGILAFNLKTLILFVAAYTGISWIVVTVATFALTKASLKASGLYYLGNDNFLRYLRSPFTWIFFAAGLVIVGYIQMIQVGGMIRLFEDSKSRKKVNIDEVVLSGVDSAGQVLIPANWSIFLFMILMLPYLGMFSLTNVSFSVAVPGFLQEYLLSHRIWTLVYVASIVLVFVFTIRWTLSLHIFVLEKRTFRESKRKSINLMKNHYVQAVVYAAVAAVIWLGISWLVLFLSRYTARGVLWIIFRSTDLPIVTYTENVLERVLTLVGTFLVPCFTLAFLSALFDRFEEEEHEDPLYEIVRPRRNPLMTRTGRIVFLCALLGCGVVFFVLYLTGRPMHNSDLARPEIVAHKGDSLHAPENTLPAFEMAVSEGVSDWIEMDVRLTADGVVVVSHDDRLSKYTKNSAYIHSMNYDEIRQIDVGSSFNEKYAGTYIPTLDEALDLCKNRIRVQIEIKHSKYDKDLEEKIVALVREKEMEDQCVVTSLSSAALVRIHELAPDLVCVYSMAAANGNIADIPYADWFTIEESNITETMVGQIHAKGKRVYAWTVNDVDDVQKLIDAGVDGILTDDPVMIDHALLSANYSGGFLKTLRSLTESPNFILQFGF